MPARPVPNGLGDYIQSIQWPDVNTYRFKGIPRSDFSSAHAIWNDTTTSALLTGELTYVLSHLCFALSPVNIIKGMHFFPNGQLTYKHLEISSGRNTLLSAFVRQQTGAYRSRKQCGSKASHLLQTTAS